MISFWWIPNHPTLVGHPEHIQVLL
jgi:hypothetical protein